MPVERVTMPLNSAAAIDRGFARIASLDEYEAATERARELADYPEGTPQADELAGLVQALMDWDRLHDDATSWH